MQFEHINFIDLIMVLYQQLHLNNRLMILCMHDG